MCSCSPGLTQFNRLGTRGGKYEWKPHYSSLLPPPPPGQAHILAKFSSAQGGGGNLPKDHLAGEGETGEEGRGREEMEEGKARGGATGEQPWVVTLVSRMQAELFVSSKIELNAPALILLTPSMLSDTHSLSSFPDCKRNTAH